MEGQGVDGHVGDDFLFFVFIFFHNNLKWCSHCDFPCTALNVKAARNSKQTRVNDKRNNASL